MSNFKRKPCVICSAEVHRPSNAKYCHEHAGFSRYNHTRAERLVRRR